MGNDGGLVQVVQDVAALAQRKRIAVRPRRAALKQIGHDSAHAPWCGLTYHVRWPCEIFLQRHKSSL
jgi:hypothetical protein